MGEEIATSQFSQQDFDAFRTRLSAETKFLQDWFAQGRFHGSDLVGGFEVETWLIDHRGLPAPSNEAFLQRLINPLVVPELSLFNVEINTPPQTLSGNVLRNMEENFTRTWRQCNEVARTLDAELLMIGILPTVQDRDLTLAHMSSMERYKALNEQVLKLRRGRPITLDIHGRDHLRTTHENVMLEAAATSFQIHLQVPQAASVRFFNSAAILAAPMVAASANSPYLFGCDLWDETRIPLFEQAVAVSPLVASKKNRVAFGHSYVRQSLLEYFQENLESYDVLLPTLKNDPIETLCHLRLHNGTIWRWNRPLIGFNEDGTPHLRIEHRVVPAGPSVVDTIANAALFFGLVRSLSMASVAPETVLPFEQARDNFYTAAKHGLRASIVWFDGKQVPIRALLLKQLLPLAQRGLEALGLADADITRYLSVIESRLDNSQNGATWQRSYVNRHGKDMMRLIRAYREHQQSGAPVHEWTF
jgi:hypothetical protein